MATNLAIDNQLLQEALLVNGLKTKKDTVNIALKEFVSKRKQQEILKLFGKLTPDQDYNYKKGVQKLKILVDTPIWSYALRSKRAEFNQHVNELESNFSKTAGKSLFWTFWIPAEKITQ